MLRYLFTLKSRVGSFDTKLSYLVKQNIKTNSKLIPACFPSPPLTLQTHTFGSPNTFHTPNHDTAKPLNKASPALTSFPFQHLLPPPQPTQPSREPYPPLSSLLPLISPRKTTLNLGARNTSLPHLIEWRRFPAQPLREKGLVQVSIGAALANCIYPVGKLVSSARPLVPFVLELGH